MKLNVLRRLPRSGIYWGLAGIAAVILTGATGYHLIEGWDWLDSLYMTIVTVSTVGYKEVHDLSPAGRIFTLALILAGTGLVTYFITRLVEFFFQRSLHNVLGRKAMDKKIRRMKGHTIICGYGRTGRHVAEELLDTSTPFVVVENDRETLTLLEEQGIPHVGGDASEEEILEAANIATAASLVAALDSDAENLFLTLTARGMRPDLFIIARIHDPTGTRKFLKAGASRVVSPIASGAAQIAHLITQPGIVDLIELVAHRKNIALQVFEHPIAEGDALAGKTLSEARVRQSVGGMVIAIKHADGRTTFDPGPETLLQAGDVLVLIRRAENGKTEGGAA